MTEQEAIALQKIIEGKNVLKFKKPSRLTVVACLLLLAVLVVGCTTSPPQAGSAGALANDYAYVQNIETDDSAMPVRKSDSAMPARYIGARSRTNNWAAGDTASGSTAEDILDGKLNFIENIWAEKEEPFIVAEGISQDGITNTSSLRYLYENSEVYRHLIAVSDTLYIQPETSFSRFLDEGEKTVYVRYAFYLENPAQLSLSASYRLEEGRLSIIVVSPNGEILHQNELTSQFTETISVQIEQGIGSVVLVYDTASQECSGEMNIMGTVASA